MEAVHGSNQDSAENRMITNFRNKYRFLSNFYPVNISYEGLDFISVEHAFQAAKTESIEDRKLIQLIALPAGAKRFGRRVRLRPDWETVKLGIMYRLVWQKFSTSPRLKKLLLDTGTEELIEGNTWGDTFWGECPLGTGSNHLGRVLMKVRKSLRDEPDSSSE